MGLLWDVTGKTASKQWDGTWSRAEVGIVIKEAGTHTLGTYIDRRQTTVTEWVTLKPIYEVCYREIGYGGGGRHRETWWKKITDQKQLVGKLEEVLEAARA